MEPHLADGDIDLRDLDPSRHDATFGHDGATLQRKATRTAKISDRQPCALLWRQREWRKRLNNLDNKAHARADIGREQSHVHPGANSVVYSEPLRRIRGDRR